MQSTTEYPVNTIVAALSEYAWPRAQFEVRRFCVPGEPVHTRVQWTNGPSIVQIERVLDTVVPDTDELDLRRRYSVAAMEAAADEVSAEYDCRTPEIVQTRHGPRTRNNFWVRQAHDYIERLIGLWLRHHSILETDDGDVMFRDDTVLNADEWELSRKLKLSWMCTVSPYRPRR